MSYLILSPNSSTCSDIRQSIESALSSKTTPSKYTPSRINFSTSGIHLENIESDDEKPNRRRSTSIESTTESDQSGPTSPFARNIRSVLKELESDCSDTEEISEPRLSSTLRNYFNRKRQPHMHRGLSSRHSSSKTSKNQSETSILTQDPEILKKDLVKITSPEQKRAHERYLMENFINSQILGKQKTPERPSALSTINNGKMSPTQLLKSYQQKFKAIKTTPPKYSQRQQMAASETSNLLRKTLELESKPISIQSHSLSDSMASALQNLTLSTQNIKDRVESHLSNQQLQSKFNNFLASVSETDLSLMVEHQVTGIEKLRSDLDNYKLDPSSLSDSVVENFKLQKDTLKTALNKILQEQEQENKQRQDAKLAEEKLKQLEAKKQAELVKKKEAEIEAQEKNPVVTELQTIAPQNSASLKYCLETYTSRVKFIDEVIRVIENYKNDASMKEAKMEITNSISSTILSMSSRWAGAKLQMQVKALSDIFLNKKLLSTGGSTFTLGEEALKFAAFTVSEKFIKSAMSKGKDNSIGDSYLYGMAISGLWATAPDFGQLFLANLTKKCPQIIPHYLEISVGESQDEYMKRSGWQFNRKGIMEDPSNHFDRVEGLFRLYVSICQSPLPPNVSSANKFGLKNLWSYLSLTVNNPPCRGYTARLLNVCLEQAGFALFERYKKMYLLLLKIIEEDLILKLKGINEEMSYIEALKDTLKKQKDDISKNEFREHPERLGSKFWLKKGDAGVEGDSVND